MLADPAWPLAVALKQLAAAPGAEVDDAGISAVITAGGGSPLVLGRAYGRGLALAGALPDDDGAQRAVILLSKALRDVAAGPQ